MMQIYHYNQQLVNLRRKKKLSQKQAAKEMKISHFSLYLYEMGYIHPSKKRLALLENFYGSKIDYSDDKEYPGPIEIKHRKPKYNRKKLFLLTYITGAISLVMVIVGSILLNTSIHDSLPRYGQTYIQLKEKAEKEGKIGRDLVTEAEYSYLGYTSGAEDVSISFYKIDSLLYLNECTYSVTLGDMDHPEFGTGRFHYRFGDNLGVSSYRCFFDFGSNKTGDFFSCSAMYKGEDTVDRIENLDIKVDSTLHVDEEYATTLFNIYFKEAVYQINKLLSESLDRQVSLYNDFLPDREKGRRTNFAMQIAGLILLFPSICLFFGALYSFAALIIRKRKTYLIPLQMDNDKEESINKLPKDIHLPFVIPDKLLIYSCNTLKYLSVTFIIIGFLAKFLLPLPAFFTNTTFLTTLRNIFIGTTFLKQFVVISSLKKESSLWFRIVNNLTIYFLYACLETAAAGIFDMWGYNIGDFLFSYIPGGVYQILVFSYLIYFFLFFKPKSVKEKYTNLWRLLSFIPLGLLIACILISNSYDLFYGSNRNIYLKFWFPEALSTIALITVLFIYITYLLRFILKKKYGGGPSLKFLFSNRYMMISNSIYIGLIILLVVLDLFVFTNQFSYYLGFRNNYWLLLLIPFVFFLKCSPSTMEQMENEIRI